MGGGAVPWPGGGLAMINRMIFWSNTLQLSELSLSVITANKTAIALYERIGFKKTGHPTVLRQDSALIVQPMRLILSSTSRS